MMSSWYQWPRTILQYLQCISNGDIIILHEAIDVWDQQFQMFVLHAIEEYRQVSNISRTKSQHLKDSRTVLRLSLPNPLKPDV